MKHSAMNLDTDWGIGEKTFSYIVEIAKNIKATHIVEFGSGLSTARLTVELPQSHIMAIEHNVDFYIQTIQSVFHSRCPGLSSSCSVEYRPLAWQMHGMGLYRAYAHGPFPRHVDLVIIDGPPGAIPFGREACLYQIWNYIRIGGIVILDDTHRKQEQEIIHHWKLRYHNAIHIMHVPPNASDHGIAILTKKSNSNPSIAPYVALRVGISQIYHRIHDTA